VKIFTISRDWSVFVLEDDAKRIDWFKERLPEAVFSTNAEDALRVLATTSFRAIFLDHDLTFADAAFPDAKPTSGVRVASFLKSAGFQGVVVIHSVNERGAAKMKLHLPNAHIAPFGTFELKYN
jgi:hypothetical protein